MPVRARPSAAAARHPAFEQALQFDAQGRHDAAVAALRQATSAGDLEAAAFLGGRLLVGRAAPRAPREAFAILARAAKAGGAQANLFMANLAATGEGEPQSWAGALRYLRRAAELGSAGAQAQLSFLAGAGMAASWAAAARAVDLAAWLTPPPAADRRRLSEAPSVQAVAGFLDARTCAWLVERGRPGLKGASIVDPLTGIDRADPARSNRAAPLDLLSTDLVALLVQARLAALLGRPVAHFEQAQVLRYRPGQTFGLHHDCLPEPRPACEPGQRVATALLYLNDGYEGGETDFPRLGLRHRGGAGELLWFANVGASGRPDPTSLHAGLPPTSGEKWVLSQWIRDRGPPVPATG